MSARAERRSRELLPDDPRHGTVNGYRNLYCRCDRCREAHREAHAAYMASSPAQREAHAIRNRRWGRTRRWERYWDFHNPDHDHALEWLNKYPAYRQTIRQRIDAAIRQQIPNIASVDDAEAERMRRSRRRRRRDHDDIGREIEGCG